MAWINLTRLDKPLQTLFNTTNYDPGEHHWNIMRGGEIRVGIEESYLVESHDQLPVGRWIHLAAQLDRNLQISTYYIDGVQVERVPWDIARPIVFGACAIGAYPRTNIDNGDAESSEISYDRQLKARIDEFSMFARILSAEEIQQSYQAGKSFE